VDSQSLERPLNSGFIEEDTDKEYEKKAINAEGEILGNKFNLNYKGSNKCPNGNYWVNGYERRVVLFGKAYIAGHCRRIHTLRIDPGKRERIRRLKEDQKNQNDAEWMYFHSEYDPYGQYDI
jgi:hypothetical protein